MRDADARRLGSSRQQAIFETLLGRSVVQRVVPITAYQRFAGEPHPRVVQFEQTRTPTNGDGLASRFDAVRDDACGRNVMQADFEHQRRATQTHCCDG